MNNNTIKGLVNHWKKETSASRRQRMSNGWNTGNERLLVWLGEEVRGYIWICDHSISYYSNINQILKLIVILLTISAGAIQAQSIWSETNIIISVLSLILSACSGIIVGIDSIVDFAAKASEFRTPACSLKKLNYEIAVKLNSKRRDRGNANEVIQVIKDELFKFTDEMPVPPSVVPWMYQRKYQKLGIHVPNQVERLKVAEESPAKKIDESLRAQAQDILIQNNNTHQSCKFSMPVAGTGQLDESSDDSSCDDEDIAIDVDLEYQLKRMGDKRKGHPDDGDSTDESNES